MNTLLLKHSDGCLRYCLPPSGICRKQRGRIRFQNFLFHCQWKRNDVTRYPIQIFLQTWNIKGTF